jgi:hypothetical protein
MARMTGNLERQQWGQEAPFRGGCKSTRSIAAQTGEPAPTSIATALSALGDTLHSDSLCYLLVGYAIYPPTRHLAVKVRLFIDFLVERFSAGPKAGIGRSNAMDA